MELNRYFSYVRNRLSMRVLWGLVKVKLEVYNCE